MNQEFNNSLFEQNEYKFSFNNCQNFENDFFPYKSFNNEVEDCENQLNAVSSLHGSTLAQSCGSQEEKSHQYSTDDNMSDDLDQIPFEGKIPNLNALAILVRSQIDIKGINFVVDKCLDLEFDDEPQPIMRKMVRKSPYQIRELRKAYKTVSVWSRKYEDQLASRLGLSRSQVHKWHFDEKKRMEAKTSF